MVQFEAKCPDGVRVFRSPPKRMIPESPLLATLLPTTPHADLRVTQRHVTVSDAFVEAVVGGWVN